MESMSRLRRRQHLISYPDEYTPLQRNDGVLVVIVSPVFPFMPRFVVCAIAINAVVVDALDVTILEARFACWFLSKRNRIKTSSRCRQEQCRLGPLRERAKNKTEYTAPSITVQILKRWRLSMPNPAVPSISKVSIVEALWQYA